MESVGVSWGAIALGLAVVACANAALWILVRRTKSGNRSASLAPRRSEADDLAELRAEVDRLKAEIQAIKAPRPGVSPYNQALGMVQEGFPVGEVASRCGITRGEAEMLIALFGKTRIKGLE